MRKKNKIWKNKTNNNNKANNNRISLKIKIKSQISISSKMTIKTFKESGKYANMIKRYKKTQKEKVNLKSKEIKLVQK